jgi:lipopolysaccharide/colanic/teichoic acid biosynthesis glycosyltransferase
MIRFLDFMFSLLGLILLCPFLIYIYIIIIIDSEGGGIFTQVRVGKNGKDFKLYKFRTMYTNSDKKGLITVGGRDSRITKVGYYIRKYKIDELPQLVNVLIGDMSLVGPRPEVRKYVDLYNNEQKQILSVRPGITDYASIEYLDENIILGNSDDPDRTYIEEILPDKIKYNMKYINNKSILEYFKIIFRTFFHIVN